MNPYDDEILNEEGEATGVAAPNNFGEGMSFINPAEFPDLEEAEVGFNIQPQSVEFTEVGQTLRAVFIGITILNVKDQNNPGEYVQRETAVLQARDGIKINMGANLVKQIKLLPPGTPVQITYKGEVKTNGNRKVKEYDIVTLRVPGLKPAPAGRQIPAGNPAPVRPGPAAPPPVTPIPFKSLDSKDAYYHAAYKVMRFSPEEARDHLKECDWDFKKALDAFQIPTE